MPLASLNHFSNPAFSARRACSATLSRLGIPLPPYPASSHASSTTCDCQCPFHRLLSSATFCNPPSPLLRPRNPLIAPLLQYHHPLTQSFARRDRPLKRHSRFGGARGSIRSSWKQGPPMWRSTLLLDAPSAPLKWLPSLLSLSCLSWRCSRLAWSPRRSPR